MKVLMRFSFVLLLVLLLPFAQARQLNFSKIPDGDFYKFSYQWLDQNDNEQSITFLLTNDALFERFRDFRTFKPRFAQRATKRNLKKMLKENPLDGVEISFYKDHGEEKVNISGNDQEKVNKAHNEVLRLEQLARTQYLQNHYYHFFTNHEDRTAIKPDHVRIANASFMDLKPLKPLILDKVSIQNIREATNYVLAFIQNVPYSTLESRMTSSGAGFNPPLKVLWENQGDCDSKMTLTAALLRSLMPRIGMVLVYIENHAFIGIAIPPEENDISIEHNGITYVLGEPTGPALMNLGELAVESELAIEQGHYAVETYFAVKESVSTSEKNKPQDN